ncbi:hypothetical protein GLOIN_2v558411 [Rhizophagus irregularis DAOM 181602=DAOM 197198]|nr:hypothetical protein GLOIN_2v558411 [Rhizophagus irregularis DAOM 181602=DAOM 197198]
MKPKTNVTTPRKQNLKFNLDSTLIETKHIPLFASWLDKKNYSRHNKIPYELNLLYRSSRDGFNAASFHKNCDNKGATIWIAKIKGSSQLIGGYNPLDWNGNGAKNTADSFLFNFTDGKNTSTAKFGYVIHPNNAIYCYHNQGPSMGNLFCRSSNNWSFYTGDIYPDIDISAGDLAVENYEVFQVISR